MHSLSVPAAVLCLAAAMTAQFTIASTCGGTTQFGISTYPTTTTSSGGSMSLRSTGAAGTNHLFQSWWYYRVGGDTREYAFNNSATSGFMQLPATPKNNRRTLLWTNCDGRGFNASLTYEVYATSATAGVLSEVMTISNPGTTPLTINTFHYADFDMCGSSSGNGADFSAPPRQLKITGPATCAAAAFHLGCGWDNYEVKKPK